MKIKFFILLFMLFSSFYHKSFHPGEDDEKDRIGSWNIRNGIFIDSKGVKTELAKENWKVFYNIFPKKITQKYIKQLVLVSDGVDEKTGALGALTKSNDQWQLVLDPVDVNFNTKNKERLYQSVYTLIHEFGHLITLNNTQITPTEHEEVDIEDSHEHYVTVEGKALENSYVNLFVEKFWSGGLLKEWGTIQKKYCFIEQKSCLDKLYNLYKDNYTDFVTDYAAESPEEDIAESWTIFVLEDKIKNPETIAEQKINFFYQFPELVKYRKIIRKNTRKYLK